MELNSLQLAVDEQALTALCQKWKVDSLAVFGSILTSEFSAKSDVDLLVSFEPEATPSLFELVNLKQQFESLFGRQVDILIRRAIEKSHNEYRKQEILSTAKTIYEKVAA